MPKTTTIYNILDKYSVEQGWSNEDKLGVALSFIADHCDKKEFENFLKEETGEEI